MSRRACVCITPMRKEKLSLASADNLLWSLLGRLGRPAPSRLVSTLRAISRLWLRLSRRGIAEDLTSDWIAETVCRGLLSSELLRDIRAIAGVLVNRSIRTECLIAKPLH